MADADQPAASAAPQARHVVYCGGMSSLSFPHIQIRQLILGSNQFPLLTSVFPPNVVCTLPPEYCEYGGTVKKCQEWLENNHRDMYDKIWSPEALEAATASLSVDAQKRAAKDAQKKAAKAEAAEAKQADKIANSVVTIKRIERNKKKFVTAVIGLEAFGLELKKVAKDLGKKFATGSSVTKLPSGGEEIVVQGDVSDELEEFILEKYKEIPEDNIELVDDKKKKKPPQ